MINISILNEASACIYRGFTEAVQATCDDARGRPANHDTLRALEARLDSIACDAVRAGELLNEKPPTATLMILTFGGGVEMGLVWSEKPILKESRDAQ